MSKQQKEPKGEQKKEKEVPEKEEVSEEIAKAREEFAKKFGDDTHIGGKGSQRRKHPVKHRAGKVEIDKKIESVAKKSQAKKLNEITEVNIFKDDNTVLQFKKPTVQYSFKEKVTFLSGTHETKNLKEVFGNLLKQLGPKQLQFVKENTEQLKDKTKEDDKKPPELVEDFETTAKDDGKDKDKKEKKKKNKAKKEKDNKKKDEKPEDKKEDNNKEQTTKEEEKK